MTDPGPPRPSLRTRLAAALHGEISGETVEAYRRAGKRAYEDVLNADKVRQELLVSGGDLWAAGPAQRSQFVSTWNAFALQTLGDAFVDADDRADPATRGYLPRVTAEQAANFLGQVEHWSSCTRQAAVDPAYDILAREHLPAPLPSWTRADPCPPAHLDAMLSAGRAMRDRLQTAMADFRASAGPANHEDDAAGLAGMAAAADSALDYAASLYSPAARPSVHEPVEASLRRSIEQYYRLGQLLAAPQLLARSDVAAMTVAGGRLPSVGEAGFNAWALTDPASRASWERDPAARQAIQNLWRYDPDPAATLAVQAEIDAAAEGGAIVAGMTADGRRIGNYYCCPWAAIYVVRKAVVIGGETLRPGEEFTFDVSAEDVPRGGRFKKEILRGPFHVTDEVDYCDPTG